MTMPADEIQTKLRKGLGTVFVELLNLVRIDLHEMGANVAGEYIRVAKGALRHLGHMTLNALFCVEFNIEDCRLVGVAILALGPGRLHIGLTKLNDAFMGIVADNAVVQFFAERSPRPTANLPPGVARVFVGRLSRAVDQQNHFFFRAARGGTGRGGQRVRLGGRGRAA